MGALARVAIVRAGAAAGAAGVRVTFPNGETRQLAPGPSSVITQTVVEVFAPRFLDEPAVLWLSESGNRVVHRDDKLAQSIGLRIEADRNLPDLILADLGGDDVLIVFVEVLATDGAMHARRKAALLELTDAAGFDRRQVAFLSAYHDRQSPSFRKTVAALAWGSAAWFVSEPEQLVVFQDGEGRAGSLRQMLGG
ncbi:MAG TPA: BsuBI/PstI family type II restriction endonuclease [Caulobacteraceae bacterium]|nr:BsuBI/PstI family type II restriction endonuclease [Caulobacteraceae bacterium]